MQSGLHFNSIDFVAQTFEKDDIFVNESYPGVWNISNFDVEEVRSPVAGRCYMLCPKKPLKKMIGIGILLRKWLDFKGK